MGTQPSALFESKLTSLSLTHRGKVRDIYDINDKEMLIVTTDRLSAFDVILSQPIPGKGQVLTRVADKWFSQTQHIIKNQLSDTPLESVLTTDEIAQLDGRGIIVKKLKPIPVEAIVRGYIIGSGWKDYQRSGSICGIKLPEGLQQAEQLPEPIFTPSTKADIGDHDENISFEIMCEKIGKARAEEIKSVSVALYQFAANAAAEKGIIIADTKFEFGLDENDELVLIDEVLTPDSSRFWPVDGYKLGISPPSFDKQFVRDYLETLDWDKTPPAPVLPDEILQKTSAKYQEAEQRLFG